MVRDSDRTPAKHVAVQAARCSWIIPLVAIGVLAFANTTTPIAKLITDIVVLLLSLAGLLIGLGSLFGIRRHGVKEILVSALAGIIISGLLISMWILNFVQAATK